MLFLRMFQVAGLVQEVRILQRGSSSPGGGAAYQLTSRVTLEQQSQVWILSSSIGEYE
jgi:hypothetical protein